MCHSYGIQRQSQTGHVPIIRKINKLAESEKQHYLMHVFFIFVASVNHWEVWEVRQRLLRNSQCQVTTSSGGGSRVSLVFGCPDSISEVLEPAVLHFTAAFCALRHAVVLKHSNNLLFGDIYSCITNTCTNRSWPQYPVLMENFRNRII